MDHFGDSGATACTRGLSGMTRSLGDRIDAVLKSAETSFLELARLAELDPATSFRFANLRDTDFGNEDLTGFDFTGADLRGAKVAVANLLGVELAGAKLDPKLSRQLVARQLLDTPSTRRFAGIPLEYAVDQMASLLLDAETRDLIDDPNDLLWGLILNVVDGMEELRLVIEKFDGIFKINGHYIFSVALIQCTDSNHLDELVKILGIGADRELPLDFLEKAFSSCVTISVAERFIHHFPISINEDRASILGRMVYSVSSYRAALSLTFQGDESVRRMLFRSIRNIDAAVDVAHADDLEISATVSFEELARKVRTLHEARWVLEECPQTRRFVDVMLSSLPLSKAISLVHFATKRNAKLLASDFVSLYGRARSPGGRQKVIRGLAFHPDLPRDFTGVDGSRSRLLLADLLAGIHFEFQDHIKGVALPTSALTRELANLDLVQEPKIGVLHMKFPYLARFMSLSSDGKDVQFQITNAFF